MRTTIYLPDRLARRLQRYLRADPGATVSSIIQEALEARLSPKDSTRLLRLAGLVPTAVRLARARAEIRAIDRERTRPRKPSSSTRARLLRRFMRRTPPTPW